MRNISLSSDCPTLLQQGKEPNKHCSVFLLTVDWIFRACERCQRDSPTDWITLCMHRPGNVPTVRALAFFFSVSCQRGLILTWRKQLRDRKQLIPLDSLASLLRLGSRLPMKGSCRFSPDKFWQLTWGWFKRLPPRTLCWLFSRVGRIKAPSQWWFELWSCSTSPTGGGVCVGLSF